MPLLEICSHAASDHLSIGCEWGRWKQLPDKRRFNPGSEERDVQHPAESKGQTGKGT